MVKSSLASGRCRRRSRKRNLSLIRPRARRLRRACAFPRCSPDDSDSRLAQLVAGKVFLVRVGSALLALASQVLLARWMGSFEFGIYIYAWTWVLMIGALSDMGLSSAARRFIPEYTEFRAVRASTRVPLRLALARLRHCHVPSALPA